MPTAGSLDLPSFGATVGHRAGAGGSAQWRGEQRHHARAARKAGAALRDVSTGVDSAPRGIDRPRLQVPHRPAACSCERRWRRGGTRAGGSLRSRGARVGGRRVRTQAGLLRARERPAGSGGAGVHARWRVGRREAACGHSEQPGCGAPLCLRQSARRAPAGAQRRNHSREARRVRRAPDLEPVQSRCGHTRRGSSRTRGTGCTCGASTRLRIELSGERWGVISNVKLLEPVRVEVISEKYVTTYATARARAGRPRSRLSLSAAARCSGGGGCHSGCASVDSSAAARRDGRSRSGHALAPALHGRPVRPAARLL